MYFSKVVFFFYDYSTFTFGLRIAVLVRMLCTKVLLFHRIGYTKNTLYTTCWVSREIFKNSKVAV